MSPNELLSPLAVSAFVRSSETSSPLSELQTIESPLERALEVVGDKYSLLIIEALLQFGPQRFLTLEEQITGISPRTLSARLKHLEACALIERHQYTVIPRKVEYCLTENGEALAGVLQSLRQWANVTYPHKHKVAY